MPFDKYKQFGADSYFHIYNRGNNKENIFLNSEDYNFFLLKIRQNLFPDETLKRVTPLVENSFSLICYCLMPNHFHLILKQNAEIPTSKLLTRICTSYAAYFNKKYGRVGHVFQGRFKQKFIENDSYLLWLSAYIHQNPCIGKISVSPADYKWSSYGEYLNPSLSSRICDKSVVLHQFGNPQDFFNFTEESYKIIEERKKIEHLIF